MAGLLAAWPEVELVLAARHAPALETLARSLAEGGAQAALKTAAFDLAHAEGLAVLSPWLVVNAAGPFQGGDYAVPLAAVRAGAHYVDLADARDFVAGFAEAVDAEAKVAGVLAVAGASSTPALSQAALAPLVRGWSRLDTVTVAISPGARAPRGLAVVEAIASYVGRPVRVFRDGDWRMAPGWSGLRRVYMPGLGWRLTSLCETPDLDLLPRRFPIARTALFTAGLELPVMHLGLSLLGWPVRLGWIRSLRPLARPLRAIADLLAPFGSDRGGMTVEAAGLDPQGRPLRARWALWAQAGSGPNTPAAPAAALIRALLEDREPRRGAYPCAGLLERDQILRELAHLPIDTRSDEALPDDPVLFRRLLGRGLDELPACIRAVHGAGAATFTGRATARGGRGPVARLLRALLGVPGPGRHEVEVAFEADARGETWRRRFGTARFASRLVHTGRLGMFEERFGPVRFAFEMARAPAGVTWDMVGWSLAGLPLPLALAPHIRAAAADAAGRYRFSVVAAHPWLGLLFAYRGTLEV